MKTPHPFPSAGTAARSQSRLQVRLRLELLESRDLPSGGTGLRADYFNAIDLTGPAVTRIDPTVNFNWGTGSPAPGIGSTNFSVRWSGQVQARYTETYTFATTSDDGVRLWIDGQLLIDDWTDHSATVDTGRIALVAGRSYDLTMEFYQHTGNSQAALAWSSPSQATQTVPTAQLFPSKRGGILREYWNGIAGSSVASLTSSPAYPNAPTGSSILSSFEGPTNSGTNYGDRIRGLLYAPETGYYTFWVAADDNAGLYLSNSADSAGERLIASVPGYTGSREWTKYPQQQSVAIRLVAGQSYAIETLHKQGTGADNLAVAWQLPDGRFNGPISGLYLSPLQPTVRLYTNAPVVYEDGGIPATFTVVRQGGSTGVPLTVRYSVGGTAVAGTNYQPLSGSVTIPAGASSAPIAVTPINTGVSAPDKTIVLTLADTPDYQLGPISSMSVTGVIGNANAVGPSGGTSVLPANVLGGFSVGSSAYGTRQIVGVSGPGFSQAIQIATTVRPPNVYDIQSNEQTAAAITQSDTLFLTFYARSTGGPTAQFQVVFETAGGAYEHSLSYVNSVGTTWRKFQVPFASVLTYGLRGAQLGFQVGYDPQTVQFGGIALVNYRTTVAVGALPRTGTPITYGGRQGDANWRADADARIAALRTADLTVNVYGPDGLPLDGALVSVQQQRQGFRFGSALNGTLLVRTNTPTAATYRALAQRLFNTATIENDLKWPSWQNNWQLGWDAANWVVNAGMYLRGHNLIWPSWGHLPSYVKPLYDSLVGPFGVAGANDWLAQTILGHIADEAGAIAGEPLQWDVVNEPYSNHDVMDLLGPSAMIDWYRAAHAADPNAQLYLNDYGIFAGDVAHQNNLAGWIEYLLANGAPLNGIGEQSHYGASPTAITAVQAVVNRFAAYGLPIDITEFDVNTTDEQLQADYLRDYFTLMFSEPSVGGIVQWGFWQGAHWEPSAALYRTDFSIKPNGQAYEDLVFGDWWTDTRGTSANGGLYGTRAFQGNYAITVTYGGRTQTVLATLDGNGLSLNVMLGGGDVGGGGGGSGGGGAQPFAVVPEASKPGPAETPPAPTAAPPPETRGHRPAAAEAWAEIAVGHGGRSRPAHGPSWVWGDDWLGS